jgi:HSP20 family protein
MIAGMQSRVSPLVLPLDVGEFADELRRIFVELGRAPGTEPAGGECSPPIDVFETDEAIQVAMDLPGVEAAAVRIVVKGQALLIAGEKAPRRGRGDYSFHLVERGFGRFARTVRLAAACDTARARASFADGVLRVAVPKIAERRGRARIVPIEAGRADPPAR